MRILGYIDHPQLKITVFKADDRLSIKFENELYEQTFKLGADERVHNLPTAVQLVDEEFIQRISDQFIGLHKIRLAAFARNYPDSDKEAFEHII